MAYDPIGTKPDDQRPEWRQRDDLGVNDPERIIKGADFDAEFNAVKAEFDRINRHGIVASVKYNGNKIMYEENITSVSNGWNNDDGLSPGFYKVYFETAIPEFDQHYAPMVTSFPAIVDGVPAYPCVIALQEFYSNAVTFSVHQIGGPENGAAPQNAVGFSIIIVDMASD